MKMKSKRILLIALSCLFILATSVAAVACAMFAKKMTVYDAKGELVYGNGVTSVTVEYGDTYALPQNVQIGGKKATLNSLKLLDEEGNECKLTYGSYQFMNVGEYDVQYIVTYEEEKYEATFEIVCADTVAPVINVVSHSTFGYFGSEVELPRCTYADKAGVDESSLKFTVTAPSGKTAQISNGKFLLEELGLYTVSVEIKDKNGNVATQSVKVNSLETFVDDARTGDVIYSFNDEKYTQLTVDVKAELEIEREIITEGYPTIENEPEGNGVLKIYSNDTFGDERDDYGVRDLLTQFNLHEDLLASTGYNIVIRIAVSTDTDYVKLFRSMTNYNYSSQDKDLAGQLFGLKANTWYDWEIDPISFGYHMPFENFVISFRDSGNTALYIDEIYFAPEKFVDTEMEEGVLADFDEEGYLYNVFQNVYCDPTTTKAERVDSSKFSILSGNDLPAANDGSALSPNLAPSGSALKVVTDANKGGMTFMFPTAVNLDEISRITFRMYLDIEAGYLSTMVIGFFNGSGFDGGENYWTYQGADKHYLTKEWFELDFESNYLRKYTTGNTVSGFYIYITSNAGWNNPVSHTFYFDEIKTTAKNETSEQVDEYLATFDTSNSLGNVTQASAYRGSQISWNEGSLVVKPSVSKDGFGYYFDNVVTVKDTDAIIFDMAKGSDKVKKVTFYAVNPSQKTFEIKGVALDVAPVGEYKSYALLGKDILKNVSDGKIIGIRADITISEPASDAFLSVDQIIYYDAAADTDLPVFGEYTAQTLSAFKGNTLDLRLLDIPVTDESDPAAYWVIDSLKSSDNQEVTLTDGYIFTPTKGDSYTLVVSAKDNAGNVSATSKTVNFDVKYYENKKAYYNDMLSFADNSSVALLKSYDGDISIVEDADCKDGKGVKAKFMNGQINDLTIDIGGVYQFKDIKKIVITYKITEATKASNSWWRLFLNDNVKEGQQLVKGTGFSFTDETGRGGGTMSNFAQMTIEPAAALVETAPNADGEAKMLTGEDYFTKLTFGYRQPAENYSAHGVTIIIDSIKVYTNDFDAKYLDFNEEAALGLVESGVDTQIVTDGSVTGLKGTAVQTSNTNRQDFKVFVGGEYQFKQIQKIIITYRVVSATTDQWWKLFLNDNTADGQQLLKGTGVSFSSEVGRQGETMTEYATVTIEPATANAATGLTEEDYFKAISIGYRDYPTRELTIIIDSIEIVEKGFKEEYLEFNDASALNAVLEGYNTQIVDLGDGNKALQFDICQHYNSHERYNLKINLGAKYKVSEIESLQFSYKVVGVTTGADHYWNVHLNASGSYTSVSYDNRLTGLGTTTFRTTDEFRTITLTDAGAAANSLTGNTVGGTLLTQDSYLENLFFCVNGSGYATAPNVATIQLDYIRINLKTNN